MLQCDIDLRTGFLNRVLHGRLQMRFLLGNSGPHLGMGLLSRRLYLRAHKPRHLMRQLILKLRDIRFQLRHESKNS